jgi:hypothetical protein
LEKSYSVQRSYKGLQIVVSYFPNDAEVNANVIMNYSVSKSTNPVPIDVIVIVFEILR